jgi:hypothetical protein
VGPGRSQEAPYDLEAGVAAGTYHVQCDSIIIRAVDVTFDLVHRSSAGDETLASWTQHFEPLDGGIYEAQVYEIDQDAPAIELSGGDQLIFRYTGANTTSEQAFIPNGDGDRAGGRIPAITLPQ